MSENKKIIQVEVKDKIARLVNCDEFLVCGNSDYEIHFNFDKVWSEYPAKTALFVFGNTTVEKPFYGNICEGVSVEKATKLYVGVFSGDLVTTTKAEIKCLPSIRDIAQTPKPPKPDVYNEIIELINSLEFEAGVPSDEIPEMNGEGSPGDSKFFSRGDHIHPTDTSRASAKSLEELAVVVSSNKEDISSEVERAKTAEKEILDKISNKAKSYTTYGNMVRDLNKLSQNSLTLGQSIFIGTLDVPDLWVSDISTTRDIYTYTSEEDFAENLAKSKSVKVGYFILSALETQKVDLDDYAKQAEVDGVKQSVELAVDIARSAEKTAIEMKDEVTESITPELEKISAKVEAETERATEAEGKLSANIVTVESIAKGANQAVSFDDYQTMIAALNSLPNDKYNVGQNIMIRTLQVPDLWVSEIAETSATYTYTDDETFANAIITNGSVQVGYYVLSALETQKVDLADYVKNTDYAITSPTGSGVVKIDKDVGVGQYSSGSKNGVLYIRKADDAIIEQQQNNYLPIVPSNLSHAVKVGMASNTEEWTDEEKANARSLIGAVGDTDIADSFKPGVIAVSVGNSAAAIYRRAGDTRITLGNMNSSIDEKISENAIRNKDLDYAIKVGLTTNTQTLTDEEKAKAKGWLGITDSDEVLDFFETNGTVGLAYNIQDPTWAYCVGAGESHETNIEIGSMVRGVPIVYISDNAFKDNLIIHKVTILDGVEMISVSAFDSCYYLRSVVIPKSITSIGHSAFLYCQEITDVYYAGTEEEWSAISIGTGNEGLTSAIIHYNYIEEV